MNKLKEKYIDNISNIVLTDERNAYLRLETINRYKKRKRNKKSLERAVYGLLFFLAFVSICIVYY